MTQYLSRRERREAEARGIAVVDQAIASSPTRSAEVSQPPASSSTGSYPSRRERRLAENPEPKEVRVTPPRVLIESISEPEQQATPKAEPREESTFTGSNLLAEPKTQSIVLDQVPESLPLTTGEIVTTGSITILSEPIEKIITGAMDGTQLDELASADAVTGAISIVQPVSALSVIRERESVAVVPSRTLRRGWWQPWLVGFAALIMLGAAVYLALVVLEAVNG